MSANFNHKNENDILHVAYLYLYRHLLGLDLRTLRIPLHIVVCIIVLLHILYTVGTLYKKCMSN